MSVLAVVQFGESLLRPDTNSRGGNRAGKLLAQSWHKTIGTKLLAQTNYRNHFELAEIKPVN